MIIPTVIFMVCNLSVIILLLLWSVCNFYSLRLFVNHNNVLFVVLPHLVIRFTWFL
jgi:hypothetical protein